MKKRILLVLMSALLIFGVSAAIAFATDGTGSTPMKAAASDGVVSSDGVINSDGVNPTGSDGVINSDGVQAPAKVKGVKAKNLKGKKVKVTWKAVSDNTGYVVKYSTNKKLKKAKEKEIAKATAKTVTLKKLKKGKTYYIAVAAYLDNTNQTTGEVEELFGDWSKTVKVKVKK